MPAHFFVIIERTDPVATSGCWEIACLFIKMNTVATPLKREAISAVGCLHIEMETTMKTKWYAGIRDGCVIGLMFLLLAGRRMPSRAMRRPCRCGGGPDRMRPGPVAKLSTDQTTVAKLAMRAGVNVEWDARLGTPLSIRGANLGLRQAYSGGKGLVLRKRGLRVGGHRGDGQPGAFFPDTGCGVEFAASRRRATGWGIIMCAWRRCIRGSGCSGEI